MFPTIKIPERVQRYAKEWMGERHGEKSKDIVRRTVTLFRKYPSVATFLARVDAELRLVDKYRLPFKTETVTNPMHMALVVTSRTGRAPILTRADRMFVQRISSATWGGRYGRVVLLHPYSRNLYLYFESETPLGIISDHRYGKATFIMPEHIHYQIKQHIKEGRDILLNVAQLARYTRGSHACMLFYSSKNRVVYYLNPWGSSTPKNGIYAEVADHHFKNMFSELLGINIQSVVHSWEMCPFGVQAAEHTTNTISGLCHMWSLMLMTRFLEYHALSGGKADPRGMTPGIFNTKNIQKHPFVQLDKWLRQLYPGSRGTRRYGLLNLNANRDGGMKRALSTLVWRHVLHFVNLYNRERIDSLPELKESLRTKKHVSVTTGIMNEWGDDQLRLQFNFGSVEVVRVFSLDASGPFIRIYHVEQDGENTNYSKHYVGMVDSLIKDVEALYTKNPVRTLPRPPSTRNTNTNSNSNSNSNNNRRPHTPLIQNAMSKKRTHNALNNSSRNTSSRKLLKTLST